jgi:hypothetical protein
VLDVLLCILFPQSPIAHSSVQRHRESNSKFLPKVVGSVIWRRPGIRPETVERRKLCQCDKKTTKYQCKNIVLFFFNDFGWHALAYKFGRQISFKAETRNMSRSSRRQQYELARRKRNENKKKPCGRKRVPEHCRLQGCFD